MISDYSDPIKRMIRKMIKEELRIDIYDSFGGVKVRLFLGDDIIQEEIFTDVSQWDGTRDKTM